MDNTGAAGNPVCNPGGIAGVGIAGTPVGIAGTPVGTVIFVNLAAVFKSPNADAPNPADADAAFAAASSAAFAAASAAIAPKFGFNVAGLKINGIKKNNITTNNTNNNNHNNTVPKLIQNKFISFVSNFLSKSISGPSLPIFILYL